MMAHQGLTFRRRLSSVMLNICFLGFILYTATVISAANQSDVSGQRMEVSVGHTTGQILSQSFSQAGRHSTKEDSQHSHAASLGGGEKVEPEHAQSEAGHEPAATEGGQGEKEEGEVEVEGSEESGGMMGIIAITVLVVVSITFEMGKEYMIEEVDEMNMPLVYTVLSELTTLGFIGLILFIVTKLEILKGISLKYLGDENELNETIELLHMTLFMFMVIFVALCFMVLRMGMTVQEEWRSNERVVNHIDEVVKRYCLARAQCEGWRKFWPSTVMELARAERAMVYHAIRKRFLDPNARPSGHKQDEVARLRLEEEDDSFPFNEYLSIISGETLGHLVEVSPATWVVLEVVLVTTWLIIWKILGAAAEIWFVLASGFVIAFLLFVLRGRILNMCEQLCPPQLFLRAEKLLADRGWRAMHGLPPPPLKQEERLPLKVSDMPFESAEDPPYLATLPLGGEKMTRRELREVQDSMLIPGNKKGVDLCVFLTRLVFCLNAVYISLFLVRQLQQIRSFYSPAASCVIIFLYSLPVLITISITPTIARESLYAFNVEHRKVGRVINKVMRLKKARSTLRILRFVAEMKVSIGRIYGESCSPTESVTDNIRRRSSVIQGKAPLSPTRLSSQSPTARSPRRSSPTAVSPRRFGASPRRRRQSVWDKFALEEERREINSIFCLFDTDRSGTISQAEMFNLLQALTPGYNEEQISALLAELDEDNSGEVSFEEFYGWCMAHIENERDEKELVEEVFNMIDTDRSGEITVEEFVAIFATLGQDLNYDDVRELVYQTDKDDDGKISKEEFEKIMEKHAPR